MNKINPRFTLEGIDARSHLNGSGRREQGLPYSDADIWQLLSYCKEMLITLNMVNNLQNTPMDMPTIDALKLVANTVEKFKA